MLRERGIQESWVKMTKEEPEQKEMKQDGTIHYLRAIEGHGGRYLRIVVNPEVKPQRTVTLFFDHRLRRLP